MKKGYAECLRCESPKDCPVKRNRVEQEAILLY